MTSKFVGIEEARKVLGDLVSAAQQGVDVILTRQGRPVARIVATTLEDAMTDELVDRFLATVSIGSRAVVANIVEYRIEREYGTTNDDGLRGAWMLATAGIEMDIHRLFVEVNGTARGVKPLAEALLRQLVNDGLAARVCQCDAGSDPHRRVGHEHVGPCEQHTEADVPPIEGKLLCGTCHVAEYQKTHPVA